MKTLIVLIAAILLIITGCKKDKESKSECRITRISSPASEEYALTYNAEGKLTAISIDGSSTVNFTYSGNTVTSLYVSGSYYEKKVHTLNNSGQVTQSKTDYNTAGTVWTERTYEYNGTQVTKETMKKNGGFTSIRTYQWSNGNLQKIAITNSDNSWQNIEYEYYLNKLYQPGDLQSWDKMMSGVEIFHSKNLIKKYTTTYQETPGPSAPATEIFNYTYEFDRGGKIISMTSSFGSGSQTYQYQYECK